MIAWVAPKICSANEIVLGTDTTGTRIYSLHAVFHDTYVAMTSNSSATSHSTLIEQEL